ncbi:cation diffusion facilitator family transporter [Anaerococcus cruorum]|uniref:cation diffusion facilitator family transporter n=1 Tax=Anaerococcus sp. WGS1529 TaxID=3366812 RepID=UPI00372D7DDA
MFNFLASKFIKNYKNHSNPSVRLKLISLSSIIGIVINLILVIFKLLVGYSTNSSAIINDGFNNLSDTVVSIMALVGSKVSQKPADKDHPYGHGRSESLISLLVGILIMYVGAQLFINALQHYANDSVTDFSTIAIIVLSFSILTKVYIYFLNKKLYKDLDSDLNFGVMADARNDILATLGIIIGALFEKYLGIKVDAIMGAILAVFVFMPGLDLFKQSAAYLLGERVDPEIEKRVGNIILANDFIIGYHNLHLHEYGKGNLDGSVDVEIAENLSLLVAHKIVTDIQREIKKEIGLDLSIHMDPTYSLIMNDRVEAEIKKIELQARNDYEDF